jgi:glycerophosphoryl diester phosphodiesterase
MLTGAAVAGSLFPAHAFGRAEPLAESPHPFFKNKKGLEVIAHRGGKGHWPEETLYAFRQAAGVGVDILEMDVRATADGVLVLMHNEKVDDTTDGKGSTRTYWFRKESAPAGARLIRDLDAGYRWTHDDKTFPFRGLGIKVPTLVEVFEEFKASDTRMIIEIKESDPETARSFCETVGSYPGMKDRVLVASFYDSVLDIVRAHPKCKGMATSAATCESVKLTGQISTSGFLKLLKAAPCGSIKKVVEHLGGPGATQPSGSPAPTIHAIQVPGEVVTKEFVERAHDPKFNLQVHAWTINEPAQMLKMKEAGVDGIITDYPASLLELLGRTRKLN